MREDEFKLILDREKHKKDSQQIFSRQINLLTDLVNYGSNLIPRSYDSSSKKLEDIIVIGVLLKQVVSMIDAIEILVSNGAVQAAHLEARSAFEASLYIDWILEGESEKKARYYYVYNLRNQKLWALRFTTGTHEKEYFSQVISDLGKHLNLDNPNIEAQAKKELSEINRVLEQDSFSEVNKIFENERNKKTGLEAYWYKPLGITSIRKLAEKVGRLYEYDIFYSMSAEISHATSYKDHLRFDRDRIVFEPIRQLKGLYELLKFVITVALASYVSILKHYRAGEISNFIRKYQSDWREAFLNIPSVSYIYPDTQSNNGSA